ncbi:MAG: hypothetical protein RR521_10390 [Clostridia bacterium]
MHHRKFRLAALLLAALLLLSACAQERTIPTPGNTGRRAQAPELPRMEGGGYPLILAGVTIDPPITCDALEKLGFTPLEDVSGTLAPSEFSDDFVFVGKNGIFHGNLYNNSMSTQRVSDCPLVWLDASEGEITACLPTGMPFGTPWADLLEDFGEPDEAFSEDGFDVYCYGTGLYRTLNLHIDHATQRLTRIESYNIPAAANAGDYGMARVPHALAYRAPGELGTKPESGIFAFDGELYQLPVPVSALAANGWGLYAFEGTEPSRIVAGYDCEPVTLTHGQRLITLSVQNVSRNAADIGDCFIDELAVNEQFGAQLLRLPGDIVLGISSEALFAALGERCKAESAGDQTLCRLDLADNSEIVFYLDHATNRLTDIRLLCNLAPLILQEEALP